MRWPSARAEPGVGTQAARRVLKKVLKPLKDDRVLSGDIEAVARCIDDGSLLEAVDGRSAHLT
jgi:histidine ammonia-lyase